MREYMQPQADKPKKPYALLWCLIVVVIGAGIYFFWPADKDAVIITNNVPLKGILYSDDKPSAVIGDKIMYEGDSFNGIEIVKIRKTEVDFQRGDKSWTQQVAN